MSSPLASLVARSAVIAALALALGLSGCGRKGALDPPPGTPVEQGYVPGPPPPPGPNGQPAATPAPKKRLPIDWLLD